MIPNIPKMLLTYLIPRQMQGSPSYGYGIIEEIKQISNDHWEPSYGTIYGAINRLERNGYIERTETDHEDRKYYTLTSNGEDKLTKIETEMKQAGEESQERVLGFLNIYREVFGEKTLNELLQKIQSEFKK